MDTLAKLIDAVAHLLWPAFAFYFLWLFKPQLTDVLKRLSRVTKWKGLGQEIELDELEKATEKAKGEIVTPQQPEMKLAEPRADQASENEILREAAKSPKAALLLLGSKIQQRLRQLLAATGWQQNIKAEPLLDAIDKLRAQGSLPEHVSGSLKLFLDVRNKLIHGGQATDDDVFRAIDSGLTLLRAIESIPAEVNVVHRTGVRLYSDPECARPVSDAKGVVLETTSPGGTQKSFRIYPTTRTHFQEGKRVAWEWNLGKIWGHAWYRDPETNEVKEAWNSSAEFVGRHLDDV
jgi:hypothetical protein